MNHLSGKVFNIFGYFKLFYILRSNSHQTQEYITPVYWSSVAAYFFYFLVFILFGNNFYINLQVNVCPSGFKICSLLYGYILGLARLEVSVWQGR